jgi:hypothetical protein
LISAKSGWRLGEGPELQAQRKVLRGEEAGVRDAPQGRAQPDLRGDGGIGGHEADVVLLDRRSAARIRPALSS